MKLTLILLTLYQTVLSNHDFCKTVCGFDNTVCKMELFSCNVMEMCAQPAIGTLPTPEDRQFILDQHNNYRNFIAMGTVYEGGNAQAADMNCLSYSLELEFIAQCWTNNCIPGNDDCRATPHFSSVGQNVYIAKRTRSKTNYTTQDYWLEAVKDWWEERRNTEEFFLKRFHESSRISYARFTQMVWSRTQYLGCGLTMTKMHVYIACNYAPKGNMEEAVVYEMGPPRSLCSMGNSTFSKYKYLCGSIVEIPTEYSYPFDISAAQARIWYCFKGVFVLQLFFLY